MQKQHTLYDTAPTFLILVDSLHFTKLLQLVPQFHHRLVSYNSIPGFRDTQILFHRVNTCFGQQSGHAHLLPKWIHNALPKNIADLFPRVIPCFFQEHGIKVIRECKQSKHCCIQVARILVALYPSLISQVLPHLVALNCLVTLLFQWVINKGCRTAMLVTVAYHNKVQMPDNGDSVSYDSLLELSQACVH